MSTLPLSLSKRSSQTFSSRNPSKALTNEYCKISHSLSISLNQALNKPPVSVSSIMATDESGDMLKNMDWKTVGNSGAAGTSINSTVPVTKKRLPKKIRQVPDYYFIPRLSWPKAIGIYGTVILAGIGAGMLGEIWIKKKIKEDGGVVFEMK